MKEIIKHYKTILPAEQFLLGGSMALKIYGLTKAEPGDIDIILVNPSQTALEVLANLEHNFPAETKPSPGGAVSYIFKHENTKIDVFVSTEKVQNTLIWEGIELNPIQNIISAKKRAARPKDWLQLRGMAQRIVSDEELKSFLNIYR